ncbi:glycosyltransferase family 87 protein [Undibacter mobilis]|uniref:DUF2029 domain-containing protein n=1 Tax=Undibacter mobilis TaxID=2292256 RepID=A0A371BAT8_9BRAD|nr:glycosyltransferase family 87 protein [Undibacter mobilis]RDV04716.1 DUF2029 domain-containing protein [Undibacter mobilis]
MSSRLRAIAVCWLVIAPVVYVIDLLVLRLRDGRPFGDDFINYWSAAWLAFNGRAAEIYDWNAFHAFEVGVAGAPIDFYHYSYPPILLVLTAPLALIPYMPGLFVWLASGWGAFYAALRVASPKYGLWLALATPAVFVNAVGGQNGTFTAALLGGGLTLMERRPLLAGVLFGALACKPQLGVLLPIALVAGRYWRTIATAGATVAVLAVTSMWWFGMDLWADYLANTAVLRQLVLEDGTGVWHRMMSVFVAARRLGAGVSEAYAMQIVSALTVAVIVALLWRRRDCPASLKYAVLVIGTCLATPYLQDYDLVVGAFVAAWIHEAPVEQPKFTSMAIAGVLLLPLFGASLASLTGVAFAPLVLGPVFAILLAQAVRILGSPASVSTNSRMVDHSPVKSLRCDAGSICQRCRPSRHAASIRDCRVMIDVQSAR